jgi:benzoyl-CoA 2,3-dioxygenase component B
VGSWLTNDDDMAFISSLMKPCYEPGKYASRIAPPARGINNQPGEFEYVKIA